MLSASRRRVAISRMVGKAEKSSGRWIHSATMRIKHRERDRKGEPDIDERGGSGRNSTAKMTTMPIARLTSWLPRLIAGTAVTIDSPMASPQQRRGRT